MAKKKPRGRKMKRSGNTRRKAARRSVKRPTKARRARKAVTKQAARKRVPVRKVVARKTRTRKAAPTRARKAAPKASHNTPARLGRARRILEETVPTPPSSLNMNRHGSAARTGRDELATSAANHRTLTPDISAGDVDVNVEDAYFSGDESPGGDNSTPDQDIVDDIGKALGVEYQDSEELEGSDKVAKRDKHRWELDPASSEDYRQRKP